MPSKVMLNEQERELLIPYDSFTQMVYTWGIKFSVDLWGVCSRDLYKIGLHINPDTEFPLEKIEQSLKDLEDTGLISFIGQHNQILVVNDFGVVNYYEKMKMNFTKNNKQSEYVIPIKRAIKSGELKPYFLEIPSIHFSRKEQFIEHYLKGTLHLLTYTKEGKTYKFSDSLMYPFVYAEYKESLRGNTNE